MSTLAIGKEATQLANTNVIGEDLAINGRVQVPFTAGVYPERCVSMCR